MKSDDKIKFASEKVQSFINKVSKDKEANLPIRPLQEYSFRFTGTTALFSFSGNLTAGGKGFTDKIREAIVLFIKDFSSRAYDEKFIVYFSNYAIESSLWRIDICQTVNDEELLIINDEEAIISIEMHKKDDILIMPQLMARCYEIYKESGIESLVDIDT